jgi:hypothetical protein
VFNKFFYPTKKNVLIGFLFAQAFPIILLAYVGKLSNVFGWLAIEAVIVASLCMWRLKPDSELDERELLITLKWKSRMLDFTSALFILPIAVMSFYPEILSWYVSMIIGFPVFFILVLFSLLAKREIGYFFHVD